MTAQLKPRRSVAYFPSRESASLPGSEAFLLARDLQSQIMPSRGHTDQNFQVELSPSDKERADWLVQFLSISQYERHYLEEAVVHFVDTSANYLAYFGEVVFEIFRDEKDHPVQLDELPPGPLLRTPTAYLQLIPKADRQHLDGRRYASIPVDDVWRLTLPPELASPRAYRRLLRHIGKLTPNPPAFLFGTRDFGASIGYDFSASRAACERLEERALRRFGSVPSKFSPVGPSTEYFYIARRLQFYRAQALIRENTIAELNALLARLDVGNKIVLSGLPSAADISVLMERMHKGELSFSDAMAAAQI